MEDIENNKSNISGLLKDKFGRVYVSAVLITVLLASGFGNYILIEKYINSKKNILDTEDGNKLEFVVTSPGDIYMKNYSGEEDNYYFKDNVLYDINDNRVNLIGFSKSINFINYKVDANTFNNMSLQLSSTKKLVLDSSTVTDDCIDFFPSTIRNLSLNYCEFITNLDRLPYVCPDIVSLSINGMSSLKNLDFIYNMKNLKYIELSNSPFVTQDLLDYFKENKIKSNVTKKDIENSKEINNILDNIISPGMSDVEKAKAICLYITKNYAYDLSLSVESSYNPLNCMLDNEKAVCTGYAYLANILFNKAGIKSFAIRNIDHCWNLVELDGAYYYLDVTNMDGGKFKEYMLKNFDFSKYYISNPADKKDDASTLPTDEETMMPPSLVEEIIAKNSNKEFSNKDTYIFEDITSTAANGLGVISFLITPALGWLNFKYFKELDEVLKEERKCSSKKR